MSNQFQYPFQPIPWNAGVHDYTGDNNIGLATNDATQRFVLGTCHMGWDGSLYRYCKAGATISSYQTGVHSEATGGGVSYEALNAGSAAGENVVHLAQASITEDQYAGGYITIFHATGNGKVYAIKGNTASSSGGTLEVYLDQPLGVATTTSDNMELWANPYGTISQANTDGGLWFIGVPMALLTDTYYGWVKTRGPAFVAPQSGVGTALTGNAAFWRHDGSVDVHGNIGTYVTSQYAGHCIAGDAAGDGPLIMLCGC